MHTMPDYPDQPELALVAALTLISRYACCQSPALAGAAVVQLQAVASDARFSGELRECAGNLVRFWLQRSADERAGPDGLMLH
ncbi:MAG: hypothetical protein K2Q19_07525 [Rhodocyclaceae bacterium]|nr:hypothetical protein [Rhodocyclaceae bacterium]